METDHLSPAHDGPLDDVADLVRSARSGDREAFGNLVTRYARSVTAVAYSICGDFALSEDIGQEAFVEAWKNLPSLREPNRFVSWVCTIARRRAIDGVRKSQSSPSVGSLESIASTLVDRKEPLPDANVTESQEHLVWNLLESLPETYREPLILYYRNEQSTREVALALDENEATIRQRLKRGRDMLRNELSEVLHQTLSSTVPKTAFVVAVVASLPSMSYAAAATAASSTAVGKSTSVGSVATKMLGGALYGTGAAMFGSLLGLLGGSFGAWMAWKNCEFECQQKFVLQHLRFYAYAILVFFALLLLLIYARVRFWVENSSLYVGLLAALILGFQVLNVFWIIRWNREYRRLGEQAKAAGLPMRASVRHQMEQNRQWFQTLDSDGVVRQMAFRWSAGAWFGSSLGCIFWMVPLSTVAFWHGSFATGLLTCVCFLVGLIFSWAMWLSREHLPAYLANQLLIATTFCLTTLIFFALHFWSNPATQTAARWAPWCWLLLLMFPALSLQFFWIRRSVEKQNHGSNAETS